VTQSYSQIIIGYMA